MQQVQELVNARVDDRLSDQRERTVAYGTRRLGEALGYLMMEAIMQAISGHQWSSVAISDRQAHHAWDSLELLDHLKMVLLEAAQKHLRFVNEPAERRPYRVVVMTPAEDASVTARGSPTPIRRQSDANQTHQTPIRRQSDANQTPIRRQSDANQTRQQTRSAAISRDQPHSAALSRTQPHLLAHARLGVASMH